jgi:hypothetical protein
MSNYVIAIGGSGARCAEALIYLCAAGLGPKGRLVLLFVDPDEGNYSLGRAARAAQLYKRLQTTPRGEGCEFLSTSIEFAEPKQWSPFPKGQAAPSMENFFQYATVKNQNPSLGLLFDMLFDRDQRRAKLDIGFRGRPSIGAAVLGAKVDIGVEEPWHAIAEEIRGATNRGDFVRLFAFGSLFGGTGAAGLPTIPRLLCPGTAPAGGGPAVVREKVALGAALLLPYFTFTSDGGADQELHANANTFLLNSKEALRYYAGYNPDYNRLYVIGAGGGAQVVQEQFSIGGDTQKNKAGLVEFLAALGARDFFLNGTRDEKRVALLGREHAAKFAWEDVPDSTIIQNKMAALARLAYVHLKLCHPQIEAIWNRERLRTPWLDLFPGREKAFHDGKLNLLLQDQRSLLTQHLEWWRDIHSTGGAQASLKVELADTAAFPAPEQPESFAEEHFESIMRERATRVTSSANVWRLLCNARARPLPGVSGIGLFQRRLHEACS